MEEYVVVDMEMTGLDLTKDEVIEIGALKVTRQGIDRFQILLRPERTALRPEVEQLTGITPKMLEHGVSQQEGMEAFLTFAEGLPLVGHRISWDYTFLKRWAKEQKLPLECKGVDTLAIARRFLPELEHRSLDYLCDYYGITRQMNHRALEDAQATLILYRTLETEFAEESPKYFIAKNISCKLKKTQRASKKERERLKKLIEYHHLANEIDWENLTQSEASRKADQIILSHGRIPQGI